MKLRAIVGVVTLWCASGGLHAAEAELERMLGALGGREAIDGLYSLTAEADCSGPNGPFHTRVESFRPGHVAFVQRSERGTTDIRSTPHGTWRAGETDRLADGVRAFARNHEFHLLLLEIGERFSDHRLDGEDEVDGRACRLVRMVDESGAPAALCLAADGVPLRLDLNPDGAAGPLRITFGDWRDVGGLKLFGSFTLTEGPERVFTYDYTRLTRDDVAAERFVPEVAPEARADREALLAILRADRTAHLETDAAGIGRNLADVLVEVSDGVATHRTRDDVVAFFERSFAGASYFRWEDARPPILRLSSDRTMAWVVRRVRVRRRSPVEGGGSVTHGFESAYTSTYEKTDGGWAMTSVTSTFVPE